MKTISTLICLLLLTSCLFADHKARGRSAWAWASCTSGNCSESPNSSTAKQPLTVPQKPQDAPVVKESLTTATTAESCSSGSCGQSVRSQSSIRGFRLRR